MAFPFIEAFELEVETHPFLGIRLSHEVISHEILSACSGYEH